MISKGTVQVRYTIGVGNNIFQYMYARLLAYAHNSNLSTPALPCLDIPDQYVEMPTDLVTVHIAKGENNFHQYLDSSLPMRNYLVHTYPEDYTVYKPHMDMIRTWVKSVPINNSDDLVLHLRLGDRLLRSSDYENGMHTTVEEYIEAIQMFDFDRLHIVTDSPLWRLTSPDEVSRMKFHVDIPHNERIDSMIASTYHNSLVEGLSVFDPVLRIGHAVKSDFDYMRSFRNVLFKHGTLSWWAAALGNAEKVGVYGPWRPLKGDRNKNLGQTDFEGWFQWGELNGI